MNFLDSLRGIPRLRCIRFYSPKPRVIRSTLPFEFGMGMQPCAQSPTEIDDLLDILWIIALHDQYGVHGNEKVLMNFDKEQRRV